MSAPAQSERTLLAKARAHKRWALTDDRSAATAAARAARDRAFELRVDPNGVLDPEERARRVEHARKAHFLEIARRSAQSRRKAREARSLAVDLDRIAKRAAADLDDPDAAA